MPSRRRDRDRDSCRTLQCDRRSLWLLALLLIAVLISAAQPQSSLAWQPELLPEAQLETADLAAVARAEELLTSGRLEPALDLLMPLLERSDMRPVLATSFRVGPRRFDLYLPLGEHLQRKFVAQTISHPERLAAYRRRADARAVEALREARSLDDLDLEARTLERFLLCSAAARAAESLADRLMERGRWSEAARWYDVLLSTNPAPDIDPPPLHLPTPLDAPRTQDREIELLGKRAWAAVQLGQEQQAREYLEQAQRLGAETERFPASQVLRHRLASEPSHHEVSSAEAQPKLALRWSVEIDPLAPAWIDRRNAVSDATLQERWPAVEPHLGGRQIAIWNGRRLRWLDASTGTPVFPLGSSDDLDPIRRGTLWVAPSMAAPLDSGSAEGAALYSVQQQGDLLAIRAGDPRALGGEDPTGDRAQWMAFDLSREGALIPGVPWVAPQQGTWTGPATPGDSLWYGVAHLAQNEAERVTTELIAWEPILAPAAGTISVAWRQSVGDAPSLTSGRFSEFSHGRVHVAGGDVYVAGPGGVIAAFAARTGTPRWWLTYPRRSAVDSDPLANPDHRFRDGGDLASDGSELIALPEDSDLVMLLDRVHGHPVWTVPLGEARRVIALDSQRIVVAGRQISWLDRQAGALRCQWPESYPSSTPGMEPFGTLLAGVPFWNPSEGRIGATAAGEWWELDGNTGSVLGHTPLPESCGRGGHVIWRGSEVWVSSPRNLTHLSYERVAPFD